VVLTAVVLGQLDGIRALDVVDRRELLVVRAEDRHMRLDILALVH